MIAPRVAISALQHLLYCERQAALIHLERIWEEDAATAHGKVLHERADLPGREHRRGVRVERAVLLGSERLGLQGRADTVEFHPLPDGGEQAFPVEYKRGALKHELADRVQLCAQALCLEEMLGAAVPRGALFYGSSHRRVEVSFDAALRETTEAAAARVHALFELRAIPRVLEQPKCRACSLHARCLPRVSGTAGVAGRYLERLTAEGTE